MFTGPQGILLVTEVFPPAVGGSGSLLESVYSRSTGVPVTVLTDGDAGPPISRGTISVHAIPMRAPDWGLLRPACLARHLRVAHAIERLTPRDGVVHCGRALPEGLSARIARNTQRRPLRLGWTNTARNSGLLQRPLNCRG